MTSVQDTTDAFLKCVICTEKYTDPCTLQCHHTFCRQCISQYLQTTQEAQAAKKIPCPICLLVTDVPDTMQPVTQWPEQIQPSPVVLGLLETGTESMDRCSLCKAKEETVKSRIWCHDCGIAMCDSCSKTHSLIPSSRDHDVSDLSGEVKVKIRRKSKCKEHPKHDIEFCCKTCEKAICQTCCILYHRKCDTVVTLESMLPDMRDQLKQKTEEISKTIKDMTTAITAKKQLITETQTARSDMQSKIDLACQRALDVVVKRKEKLTQDLNRKTEERIEKLNECVRSQDRVVQAYQQSILLFNKTLDNQSEMAIYDMAKTGPQVDEAALQPNEDFTSADANFVISLKEDINNLSSALETSLYLTYEKELLILPTLTPILHDTIEMDGGTDMLLLVVNDLLTCVVTQYGKNKIIMYSLKSTDWLQYSLVLDDYAWAVTEMTDSRVAITVPQAKKIVLMNVSPELSLADTIQVAKVYYGLVFINDTFAAGTSTNSVIDIIDMAGKILKTISNTFIKYPNFIRTMGCKTLLVSDWGSTSVYSLSVDGTHCPQGDNVYQENRGLVITDQHILVADAGANKIVLLSKDGQFVKDVLTAQDGISKPFSLQIREGRLYVLQDKGPLKIFRFE